MTDLFTGLDKKRSPGRESPPRLLQVHDLQERMVLADKLQEANRQLVQALNQNEKLVNALYEAREQITALEDRVGTDADPLRAQRRETGDRPLMDAKSGYLLERLRKSELEELTLAELPDIGYDDIGGLTDPIQALKDAVELPYLCAASYKGH